MVDLEDGNRPAQRFERVKDRLEMRDDLFGHRFRDEDQVEFLPVVVDVKRFALEKGFRRGIRIQRVKLVDEISGQTRLRRVLRAEQREQLVGQDERVVVEPTLDAVLLVRNDDEPGRRRTRFHVVGRARTDRWHRQKFRLSVQLDARRETGDEGRGRGTDDATRRRRDHSIGFGQVRAEKLPSFLRRRSPADRRGKTGGTQARRRRRVAFARTSLSTSSSSRTAG